jgi:3-methyladenine DNA glycosylase AlkD
VNARKSTRGPKPDPDDRGAFTAKNFLKELYALQSDAELKKFERFFSFSAEKPLKDDKFIGVKMGNVFALAKKFIAMVPSEIEVLMESEIHEARAGALSVMDKQGRSTKTTEERRKELFELYINRHDRVNSWDLVDLGAQYVIGRYLIDKPRKILYKLARSKDPWERRTSIVATAWFIRNNQLDDTFSISEILLKDKHELVNKATGWMLRFAGDKDVKRLRSFLDAYGSQMPRVMLRNAIEKFQPAVRQKYLAVKQS